jgi:hypothetical protein
MWKEMLRSQFNYYPGMSGDTEENQAKIRQYNLYLAEIRMWHLPNTRPKCYR